MCVCVPQCRKRYCARLGPFILETDWLGRPCWRGVYTHWHHSASSWDGGGGGAEWESRRRTGTAPWHTSGHCHHWRSCRRPGWAQTHHCCLNSLVVHFVFPCRHGGGWPEHWPEHYRRLPSPCSFGTNCRDLLMPHGSKWCCLPCWSISVRNKQFSVHSLLASFPQSCECP